MTLDQFLLKYPVGAKVDYDGRYGAQCFDLANMYAFEVLNFRPKIELLAAADIFTSPNNFVASGVQFKRVANSPTNYPQRGDIIVWNKSLGGGFGHVAVVLNANVDNFQVIEQDGITQKGVQITTYPNYRNVSGWLNFDKIIETEPMQPQIKYEAQNKQEAISTLSAIPDNLIDKKEYGRWLNDNNIGTPVRLLAETEIRHNQALAEKEKVIGYNTELIKKIDEELMPEIELLRAENNRLSKELFAATENKNEGWSWSKFTVGLSKNATLTAIVGILVTSAVSYAANKIPELAPYQGELTKALLGLLGIAVGAQNINNLAKTIKN